MKSSNRLIVAMLAVAALAIAFWVLALSPKREEADELSAEAGQLRVALSEAQTKAVEAAAAKREFPADYHHLVVLGQAAPAGDETSSLLVELSRIADKAKVEFSNIQLEGSGEISSAAAAPTESSPAVPAPSAPGSVPAAATVPPTEAAASVLPLGAKIGAAGLGVMPYGLTFSGNFFQIANFIKGIDSLVHASGQNVAVDGHLVTINGFSLSTEAGEEEESHKLNANFAVTTYVTPPEQGVTAGATPLSPAPVTTAAGASEAASTAVGGPSNPTETVGAG